jgi:hypothetical protein
MCRQAAPHKTYVEDPTYRDAPAATPEPAEGRLFQGAEGRKINRFKRCQEEASSRMSSSWQRQQRGTTQTPTNSI